MKTNGLTRKTKVGGFTLVEVLVYTFLTTVIFTAVTALAVVILRAERVASQANELVQDEMMTRLQLDRYLKNIATVKIPDPGNDASKLVAELATGETVELDVDDESLYLLVENKKYQLTSGGTVVSDLVVMYEEVNSRDLYVEFTLTGGDEKYQLESRYIRYVVNIRNDE